MAVRSALCDLTHRRCVSAGRQMERTTAKAEPIATVAGSTGAAGAPPRCGKEGSRRTNEDRRDDDEAETTRTSTAISLVPRMAERARTDSRASYRSSRSASALSATSETTHRASSSLASRPPQHPKTPKPSAARYGGLAERDLQKVRAARFAYVRALRAGSCCLLIDSCRVRRQLQSSIRAASKTTGRSTASFRDRQEPLREAEDEDDAGRAGPLLSLHRLTASSLPLLTFQARTDPAPEGSFVAETSFTRAPLNSRLPHVSPHRVAAEPSTRNRAKQAAHARDDSDDISDSGSAIVDEDEDPAVKLRKEKLRRKKMGLDKESLEGLSAELQEALVTEDLLYVLAVRTWLVCASCTWLTVLRRVSRADTSSTIPPTRPRTTTSVCKAHILSSTLALVRWPSRFSRSLAC